MHSTTDYLYFEIIYCFNSLTHLDLFPLPIDKRDSLDGNRKAQVLKDLYENVRWLVYKKQMSNMHLKLCFGTCVNREVDAKRRLIIPNP